MPRLKDDKIDSVSYNQKPSGLLRYDISQCVIQITFIGIIFNINKVFTFIGFKLEYSLKKLSFAGDSVRVVSSLCSKQLEYKPLLTAQQKADTIENKLDYTFGVTTIDNVNFY